MALLAIKLISGKNAFNNQLPNLVVTEAMAACLSKRVGKWWII